MSSERAGALALVFGMLAYIAIMAAHPSHASGPPIIGAITLNALVHGAAIVIAPVLAFGAAMLTRHLGFERPLAVLGLSFYAFGTVTVMLAATMSGFIMPEVVAAAHAPDLAQGESYRQFAHYTFWLNQAFANTHAALMSLGILCWSLAWPGKTIGAWALRVLGVAVGLGVLAWQMSGTLVLDIHGMGAVVLAQAVWTIAAATALVRQSA